MIELAPRHKTGLPINSPIMPAAGFFGYGQPVYEGLIEARRFGAIVTNPITLRPQPHLSEPQVVETSGGFIINTPPRNPGVRKVIQRYRRFWRPSGSTAPPTIAHLPTDDPDNLFRTARALAGLDALAGLELALPDEATAGEVRDLIYAVNGESELPLLVKLPPDNALHLAEVALNAGGDALVLGLPPQGIALGAAGSPFQGDYYGAGLLPQQLGTLLDLHAAFPDTPLIAAGGLHLPGDIEACLQMGAVAAQLDAIIFTNPRQVQQILDRFSSNSVGLS